MDSAAESLLGLSLSLIIELAFTNKGVCVGICVVLIVMSLLIGGIFIIHSWVNAKLLAIVQQKCEEYTNLACTLQSSGNENLSRIVYGNFVLPRELPHQVFVLLVHMNSTEYQCSGTLINEKFVLTAAHCVENMRLDKMSVQMGNINVKIGVGVWKIVKNIHVHPQFKSSNSPHSDICLLELEETVTFNADVRPICLDTKFENNYDPMIVSGWGTTENGSTTSLQKVELRSDNEVEQFCRKSFKEAYNIFIEKGICLAHRTKGAHVGDSGGPLQVSLKSNCSNTWKQIGVISHIGMNFYTDGELTLQLFTKVEYYVTWIASIAWSF